MSYRYGEGPLFSWVKISEREGKPIYVPLWKDNCYSCNYVRSHLIPHMLNTRVIKFENHNSLNVPYMIGMILVGHIVPFGQPSRVLRAMIYAKEYDLLPHIQLFIKLPDYTLNCNLRFTQFGKELAFYSRIGNLFTVNILPKYYPAHTCYMSDFNSTILVLEDLMRNCIKMDFKLHNINLYLCFQGLAHFHGNCYRIQHSCPEIFNQFLGFIELCSPRSREIRRLRENQAASTFRNDRLMTNFNPELRMKIIRKLMKVEDLPVSTVSTLIHGSCILANMFFQGLKNPIIFTNFDELRFGHPVVDFGRLLFTNVPNDYNKVRLKILFKGALCAYMNIIEQYPFVIREQWRQEIINNLLYAFVNLNVTEASRIQHKALVMHVLDELGCFE